MSSLHAACLMAADCPFLRWSVIMKKLSRQCPLVAIHIMYFQLPDLNLYKRTFGEEAELRVVAMPLCGPNRPQGAAL